MGAAADTTQRGYQFQGYCDWCSRWGHQKKKCWWWLQKQKGSPEQDKKKKRDKAEDKETATSSAILHTFVSPRNRWECDLNQLVYINLA